MYMMICTLDMAIFPILWAILQASMGQPITQWNPLTLQGAGLFHIAMGAVLGIAAFGRTKEKLAGSATNSAITPSPLATAGMSPFMSQAIKPTPVAFGSSLDPSDPQTRNTRNDG
jgi:hypothetical protein